MSYKEQFSIEWKWLFFPHWVTLISYYHVKKIYTSIISKLYYIPGYADSCFHILYIISDNYFTELAEKTSQISWR